MTATTTSPPATPFEVMVCLMMGMSDVEIKRALGALTSERIQQVRLIRADAIAKRMAKR